MPHPFTWVPAAGQRHASTDPLPSGSGHEYPADVTVRSLCGREVVSASGELPWLWLTCAECDDEARAIVGAPARIPSKSGATGDT